MNIEPSTPVRVVIEGEVLSVLPEGVLDVRTSEQMQRFLVRPGDPAVTVTPLDPERPTLDRETIASAACRAIPHAGGGSRLIFEEEGYSIADAVLALIQAAHPEWKL